MHAPPGLPGGAGLVVGGADFGQPGAALGVEDAVPALGAEAPLKGGHHGAGIGFADAVADPAEIGERPRAFEDADAPAAQSGEAGPRLGPEPDAGAGQARPVEQLARVALAVRCDVGMAD